MSRGWAAAVLLLLLAALSREAQVTVLTTADPPPRPEPRATDALRQAPSGAAVDVRAGVAGDAVAGLPDIEVAYHAFAAGDLVGAERMLTQLIARQPSPAAYLLRGCARFTQAMLLRSRAGQLEGAREDVRRAFALNSALWLDPAVFSPRFRAFLDEVRRE